ncbi:MAG: integrase [Syntrophobacteraceae bacterium]
MIRMNDKMLDAYKQFLDNREPSNTKIAAYNWYSLDGVFSPAWIPYNLMLDEFARELANSINESLMYIDNLKSWNKVLSVMEDTIKDAIILDFIRPLATLAILLPNIIRSRFIYATAHLCHQANRTKHKLWVDEFPLDDEIYFEAADIHAAPWKTYKKLKRCLERIADKAYQKCTHEFRNKYNHRYSPNIEIGFTGIVSRKCNGKNVYYAIGQTNPIKIDELLPVLIDQHEKCLGAFSEFQKLVREHISAIQL